MLLNDILNLIPAPTPSYGLLNNDAPALTSLGNGMAGYFVPGQFETKANDAAKTPRQLFVQTDKYGKELNRYYFDPNGKFTDMTKGSALNDFLSDPDTFNPQNPSGFEPNVFKLLQSYKNNPQGLQEYFLNHPEFTLFKQETQR